MNSFSFVIHPMELRRDAARKYPLLGLLPERAIEAIALRMSPKYLAPVEGIESAIGVRARGHFIGCPLSARQLVSLAPEKVYASLVRAGQMSADLGAGVMGLGAFTSVAGDAGVTIARRLEGTIAVTSGNSYTVYTAVEGLLEAARQMEVDPARSRVAIVGATGAIGAVAALMLASRVEALTLVARDQERLESLADRVRALPGARAQVTTALDARQAAREADLILAVSSAGRDLIFPEDLRAGAVVCDAARPRDVSRRVAEARDDVLVIEGGVIEVPGQVEFGFDFGFPSRTAFACMSETMILALEGRFESFTVGRDLRVEQVEEMGALATKHGFKLAGFRSFEKSVAPETIARIRDQARRKSAV